MGGAKKGNKGGTGKNKGDKGGKKGAAGKDDKKTTQGKGAKKDEEEFGPTKKETKKLERIRRDAVRKERLRRKYGDAQWDSDFMKFQRQLRPFHLFVRDVAGDGNCLFRALSDQLYGDSSNHAKTREEVMLFIQSHREDFEPFIEDDEPFDKYILRMKQNAQWGGHLELHAASMCYHSNIFVHQLGLPRWDIINFTEPDTRILQLSYHDGMHWSSVRDLSAATPKELAKFGFSETEVEGGKEREEATKQQISDELKMKKKEEDDKNREPTREENIVMQQTNDYDLQKIRRILKECENDVDEAVSQIVEEHARTELGYDDDWRDPEFSGYKQLASDNEDAAAAAAEDELFPSTTESIPSCVGGDVLEGTMLTPPTSKELTVMDVVGTSDVIAVRQALAACHGSMDEAVMLLQASLCDDKSKGSAPEPEPEAKPEPTASEPSKPVTVIERSLMDVTNVHDIIFIRKALAESHNDIDDAVLWVVMHQSEIPKGSDQQAATDSAANQSQSQPQTQAPAAKSTTKASKKKGDETERKQAAATAAEAQIQEIERALAEGHPLSKKQQRMLKNMPKLRKLAAESKKNTQVVSEKPPEMSSIRI